MSGHRAQPCWGWAQGPSGGAGGGIEGMCMSAVPLHKTHPFPRALKGRSGKGPGCPFLVTLVTP